MNIDKYMKKAYGFFAKNPKEQREKAEKLEKIVLKLTGVDKKLTIKLSQTSSNKKRKEIKRELEVVNELLKKASKRLKKITRD